MPSREPARGLRSRLKQMLDQQFRAGDPVAPSNRSPKNDLNGSDLHILVTSDIRNIVREPLLKPALAEVYALRSGGSKTFVKMMIDPLDQDFIASLSSSPN